MKEMFKFEYISNFTITGKRDKSFSALKIHGVLQSMSFTFFYITLFVVNIRKNIVSIVDVFPEQFQNNLRLFFQAHRHAVWDKRMRQGIFIYLSEYERKITN